VIQQWIDGGARPNISWQILAFALLTIAEVMVSIVALEYAYTQAPRTMKSLIMCFYLFAVAIGNLLVAGVNHFIQIPNAAEEQLPAALAKLPADWRKDPRTVVLPGHDGTTGSGDDLIQRLKDGVPTALEIPGQAIFEKAAVIIEQAVISNNGTFPDEEELAGKIAGLRDPWGSPIRYQILNSSRARLMSDGPDRKTGTRWDVGMMLDIPSPETSSASSWTDAFHPEERWLERRKRELGMKASSATEEESPGLIRTAFSGGQTRLHGAAYFNFFTWLMLGTAIAFIPYAMLYRPKTWLQE
jgi:POT family proton-dependent oligopeptide transporter